MSEDPKTNNEETQTTPPAEQPKRAVVTDENNNEVAEQIVRQINSDGDAPPAIPDELSLLPLRDTVIRNSSRPMAKDDSSLFPAPPPT